MSTRTWSGVALLFGTFIGCTFGGLADYELERCKPASKQSADTCERLNAGDPSSCMPFQCDGDTGRCVRKVRDNDRDGDANATCGGGDCVDEDATRSSKMAPPAIRYAAPPVLPSGNDFAMVGGQGVQPSAAYIVKSGDATCIQVVSLGGTPTELATGCLILKTRTTLVPRQPFVRRFKEGAGAGFVATEGCAVGRIGYAYGAAGVGGETLGPCAEGAALPAFTTLAASASKGWLAWYAVPASARENDESSCASTKVAALRVAVVTDPKTPKPILGVEKTLTEGTRSTRPPAMAPIESLGLALLASPEADGIGLYLLDADGAVRAQKKVTSPELVGASGVSLSVAADGAVLRFGVAIEVGCQPHSIRAVFGTIDPAGTALSVDAEAEVSATTPDVQIRPQIAWQEGVGGWVVTWILGGPSARVRRFDKAGLAVGQSYELAANTSLAVPNNVGSVQLFAPAERDVEKKNTFLDAVLRCP